MRSDASPPSIYIICRTTARVMANTINGCSTTPKYIPPISLFSVSSEMAVLTAPAADEELDAATSWLTTPLKVG